MIVDLQADLEGNCEEVAARSPETRFWSMHSGHLGRLRQAEDQLRKLMKFRSGIGICEEDMQKLATVDSGTKERRDLSTDVSAKHFKITNREQKQRSWGKESLNAFPRDMSCHLT